MMGGVRSALEERVKGWPGVRAAKMFGCPCFETKGRLFAIVVTRGIVLTQLDEAERQALATRFGAGPFAPEGRAVTKWSQVPVTSPDQLDPLLASVRKSYEAARAAPANKLAARGKKKPRR